MDTVLIATESICVLIIVFALIHLLGLYHMTRSMAIIKGNVNVDMGRFPHALSIASAMLYFLLRF